jgi:ankyrin repeat protein
LHFLQIQNSQGLFSNDFIFHVADKKEDVEGSPRNDPDQLRNLLERSIASGSVARVKRHLKLGARVNRLHQENGMTPLASAALHGHLEIIELLLEHKADVKKSNRDGNTALHNAAFMCRSEIVSALLKIGASTTIRNHRRESPIDVVSGDWSKSLGDLYRYLNTVVAQKTNLEKLQEQRKDMVMQLRKHAPK